MNDQGPAGIEIDVLRVVGVNGQLGERAVAGRLWRMAEPETRPQVIDGVSLLWTQLVADQGIGIADADPTLATAPADA